MEEQKEIVAIQDIPEAKVFLKEDSIYINDTQYVIVENYKNALDVKALEDRYTALLQKYHYIVGDWGHEQLRLKGFYDNGIKNVDDEQKIGTLQDYLREYCAFGCAYFVLHLNGNPEPFSDGYDKTPRRKSRRKQQTTSIKQVNRPVSKVKKIDKKEVKNADKSPKKDVLKGGKHDFVIRKGRGE